MSISLDGYFEGRNRELDWQLIDDEIHTHFNQVLADASAFLDGRLTYELMAGYWPTADAEPAAPPAVAQFAGIWRDMPKFAFSRTLERADWHTTILREVDPEFIRALKAEPGGDMVLGGANLARTFLELGLLDELRLYVHPVLLGEGHRLFDPSDTPLRLGLIESRTFSSGVVLLRYEIR